MQAMLPSLGTLHPSRQCLVSLKGFAPATASAAHRSQAFPSAAPTSPPQRLRNVPCAAAAEDCATNDLQCQLDYAAQCGDVSACLRFLGQGGRETASLSQEQIRQLVASSFRAQRGQDALRLVQALPGPSPRHFSALLKECLLRKDLAMLQRVLQARAAAGLPPDAYTASAEITALGFAGRREQALDALHRAWEQPACRTVHVCNAAIGAAAGAGDWAAAQQALGALRSASLSPDVVTFNSLIKAAGAAGLMQEAVALFQQLQDCGMQPTQVTYTCLFTAAAKCRHDDIAWLLQVFDGMPAPANDFVLSSFFSAASYALASRADLDRVFAILAEARARHPLNDTVYASLLMLVTRQGIADRAVDVWGAAQQDGAPLSPHLFSTLFAACKAGNSPALADVAVAAYCDLHRWWGQQDKRRVAGWVERDARVAYNSLLDFIGDAGRREEALAVFESMKRDGPLPDAVTYNTLISAAAKQADVASALHLFAEMVGVGGQQPTDHTFGALLNAYAKAGDAASARRVLDSVLALGRSPNSVLYTSLIDALVKDGSPVALHTAFETLEEMRRRGVPPTAVTYGCLLVACQRMRDVDLAFELYRQACAEGVVPTDDVHDILIGVCTEANRLDEALEVVKALARARATLQQATLNSLVRALAPSQPGRALRMLGIMKAMGMAATRPTYVALTAALARSSDGAAAMTLYEEMRALGMEVDAPAGSALITCLCRAQDLQRAVRVHDEMMGTAWRRDAPGERAGRRGEVRRGGGGRGGGSGRAGVLPKQAQVPDAAALAALTQGFAACGELRAAWRFYQQLRRQGGRMRETTASHRRMWELLIEGHCRHQQLGRALQVFDDWKAASSRWFAEQTRGPAATPGADALPNQPPTAHSAQAEATALAGKPRHVRPKLSNVTLAFLEACCRNDPALAWRMYDVCSVLRMQKEDKLQASLARPQKQSHHVLGPVAAD